MLHAEVAHVEHDIVLAAQELCGGKLAGINCRLRCYRYDAGNVYRPHVDGAWPGSGMKDGKVGSQGRANMPDRSSAAVSTARYTLGRMPLFLLPDLPPGTLSDACRLAHYWAGFAWNGVSARAKPLVLALVPTSSELQAAPHPLIFSWQHATNLVQNTGIAFAVSFKRKGLRILFLAILDSAGRVCMVRLVPLEWRRLSGAPPMASFYYLAHRRGWLEEHLVKSAV